MSQDDLNAHPVTDVRAGWDEQFEVMAAASDDRLLDPERHTLTDWDAKEWEWA